MARHRFDPFSALAGLLSVAFAIAVGARTGPIGLAELQLIGPVAILVLGLALVAGGTRTPADGSVPASPPDGVAPQPGPEEEPDTGPARRGPTDGDGDPPRGGG